MLGAIVVLAGDAAGEAQLATGGPTSKLAATAHVDFRIIIPPTLGLTTGTTDRAAVQSNGRSVTLTGSRAAPGARPAPGGSLVLTAAAHGVIDRETACGLAPLRAPRQLVAGITDLSRNVMVCTVATP